MRLTGNTTLTDILANQKGAKLVARIAPDLIDGPEGGMCIGAGNGIVPGTPLENIEAFLDEALRYGAEHRRRC